MRILAILFTIFLAGVEEVRGDIPAGWSTNYESALSAAGAAQQPLLVYFSASWCGPCKMMSRMTLTDPVINEALAKIGHVAVDLDSRPDLAAKLQVTAVPTFIFVNVTENELGRTTGFQPVGDFFDWLTNSVSEAQTALARDTLAKKELASVNQLLAVTDTNALPGAAKTLFYLCDERDPAIVAAAGAALQTLGQRNPAILLDGLMDRRLATRIQTANALRAKLGAAFEIDPWEDSATREQAVAAWRKRLAAGNK